MIFKFAVILLVLNLYTPTFSSTKEKVIIKMKLINILSFDFIQTINEKKENGSCIIKYPKKIYCKYEGYNKKIIVSDGRSLVIKNRNSGNYYIYPLKRTPLELLLDKKYLISKIKKSKLQLIDNKFLTFKVFENNNEMNVFFDKNTLILTGWQTEDIYQNLSIIFISSIKINEKINDKIFILPKNN
jgi:outer membrane lipoprotein-sorting protein|tara:strand:+ start:2367 stop:2924 length:558 start_codon:yes stop_codon:yes gene_type:complete